MRSFVDQERQDGANARSIASIHTRSMSQFKMQPKTFRSIQLLRGLACLLVVLFHSSMQLEVYYHQSLLGGIFMDGYAGVDLFFVISGFVIAYTSTANWSQPTTFGHFWYKRVTRIYPIYWAILLPVAVGSTLVGSSAKLHAQSFASLVAEWIPILILWPNHQAIIGVSWTLSYEMYFYVVFSLLILSSRLWVIPCGIIILSVLVFMDSHVVEGSSLLTKFLLSPFNLEFAAGALACFLLKHVTLPTYALLCIILIAFWLGITYLPTVTKDNNAQRVLVFGTSSFLIVWGLAGLELVQEMKIPKGLGYMGDASYMLYLIHFPVLVFANKLIPILTQDSFWIAGLNIALVGGLVWLSIYSHCHIEKPLLTYLKGRPTTMVTPLTVIDDYEPSSEQGT